MFDKSGENVGRVAGIGGGEVDVSGRSTKARWQRGLLNPRRLYGGEGTVPFVTGGRSNGGKVVMGGRCCVRRGKGGRMLKHMRWRGPDFFFSRPVTPPDIVRVSRFAVLRPP